MTEVQIIRPLLISGCQRSGTTLLRTILGQHPAVLEHPDEPHFILELYQRFGSVIRDVDTAVAYLSKHPYRPTTLSPQALRAAYAGKTSLSLRDFFHIYLQTWGGDDLAVKRPLLKDPAFIFNLKLMASLFPQATLIHIIRDPRANVSSQKARWPHYTTWETAHLWRQATVTSWQSHGQQTIPVVALRYEDILLNPESCIAALCQQLHLCVAPTFFSLYRETTSCRPGAGSRPVSYSTVDTSRLNQWQQRLTAYDLRLIEHICQPAMSAWGYEPTQPSIPNRAYYTSLIWEWLCYQTRRHGRYLKHLMRRLRWRLGLGLLTIPPKSKPEQ